jgi:hypothetical protein
MPEAATARSKKLSNSGMANLLRSVGWWTQRRNLGWRTSDSDIVPQSGPRRNRRDVPGAGGLFAARKVAKMSSIPLLTNLVTGSIIIALTKTRGESCLSATPFSDCSLNAQATGTNFALPWRR